ncbi:MAG: hypothetical protein LBT25_08305 [Candidatus Symbiothrix sp.]|nr:hypothetical protein [Candidatus Symbiothrix sp.]
MLHWERETILRKVTHEGAHSLGLYHTFIEDGDDINQYMCSFRERNMVLLDDKTENVMDYTASAHSFFRWQWERIQSDYPDVVPKP